MARMVNCVKLGREAEGLDLPPIPGELGKRVFENVSKEAWQQWVRHQTMLINENRLNLMDARARKYLAEQMERYFFGGGADQISSSTKSAASRAAESWPVSSSTAGLAQMRRPSRPTSPSIPRPASAARRKWRS